MSRLSWMSGVIAVVTILICGPAFATAFTSNQSGDWSLPATWTPSGVPALGDTVTITGSHVITVSDARGVNFITFVNSSGNKELHVVSGGSLTVAGSGAAVQLNPSTDGTNLLQIDGGTITLTDPLGSVNVMGGGLSLAKIQFTSLGGTLAIGRSLNFSGTAVNAHLQFDAGSTGIVEIGGDLNNGGFINTSGSASTFIFNGSSSQTINPYTFQNLTINKPALTATLNGAITVNGDLAVTSGVLDDGGNQISLNGATTSNVSIGANGVLKLGSSGNATFFPQPVSGANVTMSPNAAVVYQSGANGQSVNIDVAYRRLFLQSPGSTGSTDKAIGSGVLKVEESLQIDDNATNGVRLVLGPETLDVDGDINGDGEILMTSGSIFVGGSFASTIALTLVSGNSTVTYDGTGAQSVLSATYDNLAVNKTSGTATVGGPILINGNLTISDGTLDDGGNQINLNGSSTSAVTVNATGVLRLGSPTIATSFPTPVASVALSPGSVVSYQAGVGQSIDTGINYQKLFVERIGAASSVFKNIAGSMLKVIQEFNIAALVTVDFDNDLLDVDGDITGGGTVQLSNTVVAGSAEVAGDWTSGSLIAAPGTTVTYDGSGPQTMLAATYRRLTINKPSGNATAPPGNTIVQEIMTLNNGNVDIAGTFTIDVGASITRISGHFLGPLRMGMDGTSSRVFHVGMAGSYLPVDIEAGNPGLLALQVIDGLHPNRTGNNTLARYWSFPAGSTVASLNMAQFNYNDPGDIAGGDETKFRLARFSGSWTDFGDVTESVNNVIVTGVGSFVGDWVIGQKGSTGFAGKLAITTVNGGSDPNVNAGFPVQVQSQHDNGTPANVTATTGVDILLQSTGAGSLLGGFASITAGTSSATASNSTYDTVETNVQLKAVSSSGDSLDTGLSALFDVVSLASTLTVTSIADSGAGTLRDAITTFNSGGCSSPCTIDFASGGTGNIVLSSALPAITGTGPLTIDGFSGNGAMANTNSFGQPLNSVITVSLDGNNIVPFGLILQSPGVTVKGLGFRRFNVAGSGEAIKIDNVANCVIAGNYIGTDNSGSVAQANFSGVILNGAGATLNTIGGPNPADRNLLSGNASWGVNIVAGANSNAIEGNYIGIGADAVTGLGNLNGGITIDFACPGNSIGSATLGNVISGHTTGIAIDISASNTDVSGNLIGTSADGSAAIANIIGIFVTGNNNSIGGPSPSDRNLISGNSTDGILITSNGNEIGGNWIGTDGTGVAGLGNGGHGINVTATAASNKIGFPQPNRIAFNMSEGVELGTTGIGNTIQTNEIFSNNTLAIDLGADGATANDATDIDTGANNKQNFPTISLAEINGSNVEVTVSLNSSAGVNADFFVVDVYKADSSTPSQAAAHLGASGCIDTLGTGIVTNELVTVPQGTLGVGGKVLVTATAFSNITCTTVSEGTSELSPSVTVNGDVHWINSGGGAWENGANWNTGSVPAPGDNAIIDAPSSYTVTLASGQSIQSLTIGNGVAGVQTLQINTGPLTLNAASTVTSTGFLAAGAANNIQGAGTLTNNGQMTWSNGTIANGGVTNNTANFAISGASPKTLNGTTLTNSVGGSISWSSGAINFMNGGGINNAGGFFVGVDHIVGDAGSGGAFTNSGTFTKQGVSGSTTFNVPFNHTGGQVNVQNGFLTLSGGGSATAPIDISATRKILISGAYTFGAVSLTGTGKVEVGPGGTLTVTTALNFPGLHLTGGVINGLGDVGATTGGQIVWDSGTFSTGGGKVSITGSGNIQISTAGTKSLNRTLELIGGSATALWNNGTIDVNTSGLINNGGVFDSSADTILNNSGVGTGTFTNTGTFKKSAGTGQTLFQNIELVSSGTLWVAAGTVNLANATLSGTVDIDAGKTLLVDGNGVTINSASFPDSGLLQVTGGTLTMNGPLAVSSFQFDNGLVNGIGNVSHAGLFQWNGGTLSGTGTSAIITGGSLNIANASAKTLDRTLTINSGLTATWSGGTINVGTNGGINNIGTFIATTDETFNKSAGGTPTLTNSGTFRKNGGAAFTTFTNVALTSTNTLEVFTGGLNLANASISGTVDLNPGTKIQIDSDIVTIAGPTTFIDTGSVDVQGGTLLASNNVTVPVLNFGSGVVDGTAALTIGTTCVWGGGTMQGTGSTDVASGATLTMTGINKSLNTRTLRPLSGSFVNWNAGVLNVNTSGNIDNTGLFHVSFDGNINNAGTAGPFVNNIGGTLRKSTTTGSLTLTGVSLTNNGILDIDLGKVDVTGTFTQGATGSLDILLNGVVPGLQHGQLVTNSNPTLAGPLNITFNGPFQPLVNDDFAVISWPSNAHIGDFAPYNLPALANGRTWTTLFNATGLHLQVNGGNADLSIVKTASAANVAVGNPISYTLTVSNAGPDSANGVQVTDTLPTGHTGISASGGPTWTCGVVGLVVTCNATVALNTGAAPNITINATAPGTPGPISNTANVTTTNPDPTAPNNSSTANVSIDPASADLALGGTNPAGVPVGSPVAFNFGITNNGPQTATVIIFTAPIPPTLTFVSATPPCTFSAGLVTCNVGNLAASGSTSITINTTAANVGTQSITGSVDATEADPNATNDSLTLSVAVSGGTVVVTNTADSGAGSLRQALLDAQSAVCTSPCVIAFNIPAPPFVIQPASALPSIGNNTTVDGTTQPSFTTSPLIEIDSSLLVSPSGTFVMSGTGAKLTGLSITNAVAGSKAISITGNGNTVTTNFIGVAPLGATAANALGISITGNNNIIGGVSSTDGNTIANSTTNGIDVTGTAVGNQILRNSIHDNTLLGIDLGADGVTPNIAGDADTGPNNLQNSPTLVSATLDGTGGMTITGNIDSSSTSAGSILIEYFEADAAGEGKTFIANACVIGNNFGLGTSFSAPGFIAAGDSIVATATAYTDTACTNAADGTSEFSNVVITTLCTPPPATLNTPPSVCTGATNVAASVNAPTAVSFNWVATNATIVTGQNTNAITFNPGASGNVTLAVTVTDAVGCVATVTNTFPITPTPVVNITGPTATCASSPVVLDAGGPFSSYLWNTSETSQTITVSPTSTQIFSVTVTDANGCNASDTHTVNVSSNPVATITAPSSVCASSAGNNASVPAQAGATFAWTITNGTFTSPSNGASVTFTASASGNVSLGVTITVGSCTSVGNATVPIAALPVVTITGPTSTCPSTPFTLDAGPGFSSYLWSNSATSQTIVVTQSVASQVYSVTVTNAAACSATDNHTVTLSASPSATISAPTNAQQNTPGLVASVAAQAGATFTWGIVNGTITGGLGTNSITFTAGPSGITQLSVTVVTLSGCSASDTHNVALSAVPSNDADVGITKTAAASVQVGATLVYTIEVTNFGPAVAPTVQVLDSLPSGVSLVSVNPGTFTCGSTSNEVSCSGGLNADESNTISITVNAPLQATLLSNTALVDAGSNDPNSDNDNATASTNVLGAPTQCATAPPSLLQPLNGASVSSPVSFSWTAVSGNVDAYELWIVTDDMTSLAGTTTGTSLSIPLPSGAAAWYVIARLSGDCPPLTSAQRTFTVSLANGCATHGAPQLTSPAANTTLNSPVNFSWTPVPQAIGYRVWVEVNGTAAQDVGTTDGAIMLTADVPPGAIAAHVDALFSGCPDTHSPTLSFNIAKPDPCANRTTVVPLAPANNSIVNSSLVSFSWSTADADGYRLWISIDGAPAEAVATTDVPSLQTTIGHGVIDWWVELLYDGCGSTDSQHFRFTIPLSQNCGTAVPQLLSPANGSTITNASVTFNWTSVPNAVGYELWLSVGSTTPTLLGVTSATTNGTSLTRGVAPGSLEWFVRAIVDRCPARDSAHARFTFTTPAACRDDQPPHAIAPLPDAQVVSPVDFAWTPRPGATSYDLFVIRGNNAPQLVLSTPNAFANDVALQNGNLDWFVRVHFANCSPLDSSERQLEVVGEPQACADLVPPVISAPGQISNEEPFLLQWNAIPGATAYQLQTAGNSAFANADLLTTGETSTTLTRSNHGTTPLGVYARVRAIDTRCLPDPNVTPYGPTAAIFILPAGGSEGSTPLTGGIVTHFINLGSELAGQSFVVSVKEPWLTVAPSSGVVAAGGTALVITADTTDLPLGTSLGAVQITLTSSARGLGTNATTFKIPTMTVSKVTPVTPAPKSTPPPDALIIPAVAHANGINSQFQSDVRVTNSSAQLLEYQATFTPSGGDGLAAGRQTTFTIDPGRTIALDDVLRGWFGTGGESITGTLEVRPITETAPSTSSVALSGLANLVTFASSRTFNVTSNGTFGQYIPAIPFANFIGGSSDLTPPVALSLQQIAQSDRYRTNLGIVEASGDPVSLLVKVFGSDGQKLKEFPVQLAGGQHTQLNSFLATQGVGSLSDGRVEISVVGGNGKVTAYASVLDNATSDPLLVTPVTLTEAGNTKWVIPGVADLNNGAANWQTDMRLFNAGTNPVDAVLTFYSQNGGTPQVANINIPAGQVRQFDKTLASVFGKTNDGGAVHVATSTASRLVATARTYNQTSTGTYGQFISGVTPNEATGVGARPLQILQVEESNRFRSNIGLAEVTGKPVKLEITVVPPDAKVTVVTEVQLQANEFRQINSLLRSVGLADTYNARVSVRAIEGEGRVTAYASVIDMLTNDPTYVPAQ